MSIVIDIETAPIPVNELPAKNKEYLIEKSKPKKSKKIIIGEGYGNGAIGKFELSKILCCCVKEDDKEIEAFFGDSEAGIISDVFNMLKNQDHIIGFNSNSFDLPLIKMRGLIHGLYTYAIDFNIKPWDLRCVDVRYQLTDKYGIGDLKYWARVFGIAPPKWDEGMDKSDLSQYPIEQVVKACKSDVQCTYELYNKLNNAMKKGE